MNETMLLAAVSFLSATENNKIIQVSKYYIPKMHTNRTVHVRAHCAGVTRLKINSLNPYIYGYTIF